VNAVKGGLVSDGAAGKLWNAIRDQFTKEAGHLQLVHVPEPGTAGLVPNDSYLRLTLSELFLAKEKTWGTDRVPAVQASARLLFGRPPQRTFTTLVQPPAGSGSGVFEDYLLTEWLPYRGQPVELEAALHAILGENKLLTAVEIVADFASLLTPPISAALDIAGKVGAGIEKIIEANQASPVLVLHATLTAPAPGWLAVVRATDDELPAAQLHVNDAGRLCRNGSRLTGHDFLVLRMEGCQERADWRTPDLDAAIAAALYSRDLGHQDEYEHLRAEALGKIYYSPDFTPSQRRQLAAAVKDELDLQQVGAVADGGMTVADIVARRGLPARDEVAYLSLSDLLSS
jgi:hypothetical protein